MRSSSVWLVLSTGCAYQGWLGAVALAFIRGLASTKFGKEADIKKPPVSGGFWGVRSRWSGYAQISLPPGALENQK
jgi:hypothetical protein